MVFEYFLGGGDNENIKNKVLYIFIFFMWGIIVYKCIFVVE